MKIRLNPEGAEGNGNAETAADPGAEVATLKAELAKLQAAEAKRTKAAEASGFADQLKARDNDATAFARDLHRDLAEAREKLTQAEGRVPAGHVVLSASEAKALETYRKLGKAEELAQALEAGKQSTARAAQMERQEQIRSVAEAAGFKPKVLATLAGDLQFEIRDEKVGARDAKVAYALVVEKEGEEPKAVKLADYAARQWAEFLPSLKPGQQSQAAALPRGYQAGSGATPDRPVPQHNGGSNGVRVPSRF